MMIFYKETIQLLHYTLQFTPSASVHKEFYKTPTSIYEGKIDFGKYYGG